MNGRIVMQNCYLCTLLLEADFWWKLQADLKQRNTPYQVYKVDFKDVDRAILDSKGGFVKILTADKKDTILGATIVAADAGNIISEITVAIQAGMGLGALASVIHPYPTQVRAY